MEPIKPSAKRVALLQYILFTILCTVCYLAMQVLEFYNKLGKQMDLSRQCISLKTGLYVIVGRDVKYLYLGGEAKGVP